MASPRGYQANDRCSFTRPPPISSLEEDILPTFLIVVFNSLQPLHLTGEVGTPT